LVNVKGAMNLCNKKQSHKSQEMKDGRCLCRGQWKSICTQLLYQFPGDVSYILLKKDNILNILNAIKHVCITL
jgi:hypothetical protein